MTINKNQEGSVLHVALEGRLDTTTAPSLEEDLQNSIKDITELDCDFTDLEYISSAGRRVLLSAQKIMNKQGKMSIRNVNSDIMDVFEITGFTDILSIES